MRSQRFAMAIARLSACMRARRSSSGTRMLQYCSSFVVFTSMRPLRDQPIEDLGAAAAVGRLRGHWLTSGRLRANLLFVADASIKSARSAREMRRPASWVIGPPW
jgi:hypothetical protein